MPNSDCYSLEEATQLVGEHYRVEALVGVGGMACVYRAREHGGSNRYALKILRPEYIQDSKILDIFKREANTMHNFQHPNIVRFYRYVEDANSPYIRMDYIEGYSLADWLRQARRDKHAFTPDEVILIAVQIGAAVHYLHLEHQLHMDIKPGNILIQEVDGKVFLTDLGVAMEEGGKRQYIAGTPYYMPYEQQNGDTIDRTADIYAFAVVLYELLAGQRPFDTPSTGDRAYDRDQLKELHRTSVLPPLSTYRPGLPTDIDAIIAKALAKSPTDRYQSIMEFIEALHHAFKPQLVPALHDLSNLKTWRFERGKLSAEQLPTLTPGLSKSQRSASYRVWGLIAAVSLVSMGILLALMFQGAGNSPSGELLIDTETTNAVAQESSLTPLLPTPVPGTETAIVIATTEEATEFASTSESMRTAITIADTTIVPTQVLNSTASTSISTDEVTSPPPSPTASATTTPTATDTPIPATVVPTILAATLIPTAIPTAFLSNVPLLYILEGADAIGLDSDLNTSINWLLAEEKSLIPLRLGMVNGFSVSFEVLSNPNTLAEYGIAYRYQDEANYWLFMIETDQLQWQLVRVESGVPELVLEEPLTTLPHVIRVSGLDSYFRFEFDEEIVQHEHDTWPVGSAALWLQSSDPNIEALIDKLQLGLLGSEAIAANQLPPTLPAPQVDLKDFLLADLRSLQAAGDTNANIDCAIYTRIYDSLERHLLYPATRDLAQEALEVGRFIRSRCDIEGTDRIVNFNDSFSDFLNWELRISQLFQKF